MSLLKLENTENISWVTLTNGKSNTITLNLLEEFLSYMQSILSDPSVKVIVLTGAGKFFSSGFDLVELYDYSYEELENFLRKFSSLYQKIFTAAKPTIASINGHAVAGGYILASTCDFRIMARGDFKVGVNEVMLGVPYLSMPILRSFLTGKSLREAVLQGRFYTPEEVLSLGLIDQIVQADKLRGETLRVAKELCNADPKSYQYTKEYVNGEYSESLKETDEIRLRNFLECWFSTETRERMRMTIKKLKK